MSQNPAQQAIALLIDLAQKGEIDPWDVQVIEVIDRFLSELNFSSHQDNQHKETDLSQSGQAFLWASMLISLKADTLSQFTSSTESPELETGEIFLTEETQNTERIANLELYLRRRESAPPLRKRRVTLQELIKQIEQIAQQLEKDPPRSKSKTNSLSVKKDKITSITQLAHQENLTEVAKDLENFFDSDYPRLVPDGREIELEELLNLLNLDKTERVGVFWGLLLLSAQSKVELSQTQFYGDLKIKPLQQEQTNLNSSDIIATYVL